MVNAPDECDYGTDYPIEVIGKCTRLASCRGTHPSLVVLDATAKLLSAINPIVSVTLFRVSDMV
ncbi:unnamed protein product [Acanthoscelides obtectus]|uniref:Uncharacterized protein n=1 Tax=Acanthoscelides obtectus TaxID=200917 RepID=A0A9P0Q531_ACAOB|nr:unnamed protein product [Acanthoscelides obtectus]CAK1631998.1 hypothetical protein AOBTE_LOCUS7292 [Acanthoscelides obtectus]